MPVPKPIYLDPAANKEESFFIRTFVEVSTESLTQSNNGYLDIDT